MGSTHLERTAHMYDTSKLVSNKLFKLLLETLPTPRQLRLGRRRVRKEALLSGILQVLVNGVAWNKIADCGCSYSACYTYFCEIQRRGLLHSVFEKLTLEKTDIAQCASDTTTVTS